MAMWLPEALLQRPDTDVASSMAMSGDGHTANALPFDDFDRGTNRAGCRRPFVFARERLGRDARRRPGAAHQAVDERQAGQRLIEQAVRPEKLILEVNSMLIQLRVEAAFHRQGGVKSVGT